jgi:hypothetical protein
MKTRTFQEWWDGKYATSTSDILFLNDENEKRIITDDLSVVERKKIIDKHNAWMKNNEQYLVHENELSTKILALINEEKRKIFDSLVQKKLSELINDFSKTKKDKKYKEDEIHDAKVILGYRNMALADDIENNYLFNRDINNLIIDLHDIREYYLKVLKPNNPKNYGFINSPNFPYQDRNKIPYQVMATAFFKYLKWLEGNKTKPKLENKFSNPQIAIAMFYANAVKKDAEAWVLQYGKSTNSRSIYNDLLNNDRQLKNPSQKNKNKIYKNICGAKKLLVLKKDENAIEAINQILEEFYQDFLS